MSAVQAAPPETPERYRVEVAKRRSPAPSGSVEEATTVIAVVVFAGKVMALPLFKTPAETVGAEFAPET